MKRALIGLVVAALALLCTSRASAQSTSPTTTFTQATAGSPCGVTGCVNAELGAPDNEFFTWTDTLRYCGTFNIFGNLSFRGLNYHFMPGKASGYQVIDFSNGTFTVHEVLSPYRCSQAKWDSGSLTVANEYLGIDPVNYGAGGAVNGTGQVGVAAPLQTDTLVTLTSSNTSLIQVPAQVTIAAGMRDSNFTVASTVPVSNLIPTTVTVVATFPDGNTSTVTLNITYYPPPPPSDDSRLHPPYLCGSKRVPCKLSAEQCFHNSNCVVDRGQ